MTAKCRMTWEPCPDGADWHVKLRWQGTWSYESSHETREEAEEALAELAAEIARGEWE